MLMQELNNQQYQYTGAISFTCLNLDFDLLAISLSVGFSAAVSVPGASISGFSTFFDSPTPAQVSVPPKGRLKSTSIHTKARSAQNEHVANGDGNPH